jgi:hypothetical protein
MHRDSSEGLDSSDDESCDGRCTNQASKNCTATKDEDDNKVLTQPRLEQLYDDEKRKNEVHLFYGRDAKVI